jgi:hypothetical protein
LAASSIDPGLYSTRKTGIESIMSAAEIAPESEGGLPRRAGLLPGVDGRSSWARRCRDAIAELTNDLGGVSNCSSAERAIIRRSAVLITELERLEVRFATAGEASTTDLEAYGRASNTLRRLLQATGLQRRPRDMSIIDAEAEAIGHAEAMEQRRAHIEKMHNVLAEQAGTTVVYDDP